MLAIAAAASNMTIPLIGKHSNNINAVSTGFLVISPISEAVNTITENTGSIGSKRANAKPSATPANIAGKNIPPFQPEFIQRLVVNSLTTAITMSATAVYSA